MIHKGKYHISIDVNLFDFTISGLPSITFNVSPAPLTILHVIHIENILEDLLFPLPSVAHNYTSLLIVLFEIWKTIENNGTSWDVHRIELTKE